MKVEYAATDPKKGMSLLELKTAVEHAVGIAGINETDLDNTRVTILVTWSGGIKQLKTEV